MSEPTTRIPCHKCGLPVPCPEATAADMEQDPDWVCDGCYDGGEE